MLIVYIYIHIYIYIYTLNTRPKPVPVGVVSDVLIFWVIGEFQVFQHIYIYIKLT